jgi:TRAP-type uncharacterized transport system substrate-binding protein
MILLLSGCYGKREKYRIAGSIEDPQNEISRVIQKILSEQLVDTVELVMGYGSLSNLDSVSRGKVDMAIVDNYVPNKSNVRAISPLYPQILHVLHRKDMEASNFRELVLDRKVFAGDSSSGSFRILLELLDDLNIEHDRV